MPTRDGDGSPLVPMSNDLADALGRIVAAGYTYRLEVVDAADDTVDVSYICRSDATVIVEPQRIYRYQVLAAPGPPIEAYRRLLLGAAETSARRAALRCERAPKIRDEPLLGVYPYNPIGVPVHPSPTSARKRSVVAGLLVGVIVALCVWLLPTPAHAAPVTPLPDPAATTTQVRTTVARVFKRDHRGTTDVGVSCRQYRWQRWECGATGMVNGRQVVLEYVRLFWTTPQVGYGRSGVRFRAPLYGSTTQTLRGIVSDER